MGDEIVCKISGKIIGLPIAVERILYGALVLNGIYYQLDKILIRSHIPLLISDSEEINYNEDDLLKAPIPEKQLTPYNKKRKF